MRENKSLLQSIGSDLKITLSQIESGCVTAIINDVNIIIIKECKINFSHKIIGFDISFEHIERLEFPTIALTIKIKTQEGSSIKYQYFFLTESADEINYLNLLEKKDSHSYTLLFKNINIQSNIEISPAELASLKIILSKLEQTS